MAVLRETERAAALARENEALRARILQLEQAEAALRDSQRQCRGMIENSADGIVLIDEAGAIVEWNPAEEELTGLPRAEALGRPLWDVQLQIAPDEVRSPALYEHVKEITLQALQTGRFPTVDWARERALKRTDGTLRVIQSLAFPIKTGKGFMIGAISRDITARRRAEVERERLLREVEAKERLFQAVFDHSPVAIAVLQGPDLALELANPAAEAIARGRALPGRPLAEAWPELATEGLPMLRGVMASGKPRHDIDVPFILQRSPGAPPEQAFLTFLCVPIPSPEGPADAVLAMAVDTTEQVIARRRLEELAAENQSQLAQLEATIASARNGFMIFDPSGYLVRANARAMEILALTRRVLRLPIGAAWEALHPETADGEPIPADGMPIWRALRGERVEEPLLVFHPRPGRTVWVSGGAAPIRTPEGAILGAVVTFADVSALHGLQEQREDLLRAVSHDLRGPLTVIQAAAELLLRSLAKAGLSGRERKNAEAIVSGARRMNAMIQDLVDWARLEAGQLDLRLQPVDLRATLAELLDRLAGTLDTARIRVQAAEGLPPALADPDRLERILVNLLSNALKYSTPGSEVTVTVAREGSEVTAAISDQGPGIAPEELPHLFERYYRGRAGSERHGGLGLGLFATRMLVEAHGGHISAASQPGVGSTFTFTLPVASGGL